jgi:hypothetical protein
MILPSQGGIVDFDFLIGIGLGVLQPMPYFVSPTYQSPAPRLPDNRSGS